MGRNKTYHNNRGGFMMDYTLGAITVSVTLTDTQGVDIFLTLDDLPDADFAFEQIIEQVREWAETNNHIVEGL